MMVVVVGVESKTRQDMTRIKDRGEGGQRRDAIQDTFNSNSRHF